ncbi:putative oRF-60D [Escherichia coli 3-073-06_S1_C2]|uniref:hypothetical protein n=1 Tax=Escherichia coli TaxID=562 RepID=UPI0004D408CB|nr:hypothetical protein [Escherichia coli]EFK0624457.1 hypothetical protein [Escherichia coli]EJS0411118.1 hypothetical protein [Escherichia coli]EJS5119932.1 hypothetical protein [Escherichia coli]EKS3790077.1 hypothetical protein [Escherichia coli]KDZ58971.1 putative oRF-60D [Escherichia coli 3-073-06_S1_C2]
MLPDLQRLQVSQGQMMNKDKCRMYGRKRYTAGAMCFMLFVWLGGVVTLCAVAAIIMQ